MTAVGGVGVVVVVLVVAFVGVSVVGQPISSSGQSCTPLHHNVELIQTSLVGHKVVPSGHG